MSHEFSTTMIGFFAEQKTLETSPHRLFWSIFPQYTSTSSQCLSSFLSS
eukprot:COSAG01_NODE_790_length_13572_cov_4.015587_10_plen_49_part_00